MIASKSLHWHILGAGAIGSLLAARLHQSGTQVSLVARNASKARARDGTLQLRSGDQTTHHSISCVCEEHTGLIDALVITTKAQDATTAFAAIKPCLAQSAPVILLVNGMGVYEQILTLHPSEHVFCGSTTDGAYFDKDSVLIHAGCGDTLIGNPANPQVPSWFPAFAEAAGRTAWETDINECLWRKLIINAAINPLTALHRCCNGELFSNSEYRAQAQLLCRELAEISRARGYSDLAENIWQIALEVMQNTADNRSSMLQDVLAQRPTEIEFITGFLCQYALQKNLDCPRNLALFQAVKAIGVQP